MKEHFAAAKIGLFRESQREKYLHEGTKKARRPNLTALQHPILSFHNHLLRPDRIAAHQTQHIYARDKVES